MHPRRSRSLALRRALRRRNEAGAAMFIVAVTLALLATMGVYGLTATALDVRAAGHNREAMVGQNIAQHALMVTAETLSPSRAQGIINGMYGPNQTKNCRTSARYTTDAADVKYRNAQACTRLTPARLQSLSMGASSGLPPIGAGEGHLFQPDSFGKDYTGAPLLTMANALKPEVQVELTSPVAVSMPGFQSTDQNNLQKQFAAVTVTVFTETRRPNEPPEMTVIGRGRIIVGPASLDEWR